MKLKFYITITLCIGLLLSFTGCKSNDLQKPLAENLNNVVKADAALSDGFANTQMEFALDIFKAVNKTSADKNVVLSPQSISTALGMTYFGAQGETANEMADVLNIKGLDNLDVASGYKQIASSFENSKDTKVDNANSLWVDEEFPISKGFVDTMEKAFSSETRNIDLQSKDAVPTVNKWVKDNTGDMIDKLFTEPFDPLARLVLVNAIYFDGQWTTPFDAQMSFDGEFNGQNGTTQSKMMFREDTVLGKDGESYRSVYLPYGRDERYAMVAVLPYENININDFVNEMDTESFKNLFSGYDPIHDAMLYLPVFKVDELVSLKEILKSMGMETAFTTDADFSLMGADLHIGKVAHRAIIEVDEVGTKAAAATGVEMALECAVEEPWTFNANRPFIFFIYDNEQELVLFSSKVVEIK